MQQNLFNPDELQTVLIPSYSFSQERILQWIMRLYKIDRFEIDCTYSKGNFYKSGLIQEPIFKYDINPQTNDTIECNYKKLSHDDKTIKSIIFDPPFLAFPNKTSIIKTRFTAFKNMSELYVSYELAIKEFARILVNQGIFIIKCQDIVCSGKQYWIHFDIFNIANRYGFLLEDMFLLLAKSRMIGRNGLNQKHARKYHSYFMVFKKI